MDDTNRFKPYILIFIFCIVAHWMIFFDDGIYVDDWVGFYADYSSNGHAKFYELLLRLGRPFATLMYHFAATLHIPLVLYRFFAFASLYLSGVTIFILSNKIFKTHDTSLLFAILFLVFPGSKVNHWTNICIYALDQAFFLFGFVLLFRSVGRSGASRYFLYFFSSVLFVLSYDMRSLLVVYYLFMAILIMYICDYDLEILQKNKRIIVSYAWFFLLPVVYWVMLQKVFPLSHGWENTYDASLSKVLTLGFFYSYLTFVVSLVKQLNFSIQVWSITNTPILILTISLIVYVISKQKATLTLSMRGSFRINMIVGFVLFVGSIFPYAIKGSLATVDDFDSRHLIIVSLPFAYLVITIISYFFTKRTGRLNQFGTQVVTIAISSFILCFWYNYIRIEANWIKNISLAYSIKDTDGTADYSYYIININDGSKTYTNFPRRLYEWAGLFKIVWGDESRLGLLGSMNNAGKDRDVISEIKSVADDLMVGKKYLVEKFWMMSGFNPMGRLICLTATPKQIHSDLKLVINYYNKKIFDSGSLESWLGHIWDIRVDYAGSI